MERHINAMVSSKQLLESVPIELQNGLYRNIITQINSYIENYCDHHYIYDLIDINPEYSRTIQYCEKCLTTKNN